jgi:hypothetical protein
VREAANAAAFEVLEPDVAAGGVEDAAHVGRERERGQGPFREAQLVAVVAPVGAAEDERGVRVEIGDAAVSQPPERACSGVTGEPLSVSGQHGDAPELVPVAVEQTPAAAIERRSVLPPYACGGDPEAANGGIRQIEDGDYVGVTVARWQGESGKATIGRDRAAPVGDRGERPDRRDPRVSGAEGAARQRRLHGSRDGRSRCSERHGGRRGRRSPGCPAELSGPREQCSP